jgi:hypothetical protein
MAKGQARGNKEKKKPKQEKTKGGSNVSAYSAAYGKANSGANTKKT